MSEQNQIKRICDGLTNIVQLTREIEYRKFPIDYLKELTRMADKLLDPSEKVLINRTIKEIHPELPILVDDLKI